MDLLKSLNEKQKKTIILVTHNPAFLSYAHRVVYLKDGRIMEIRVNRQIHGVQMQQSEVKQNISKELELLIKTFTSLSPSQIGNLLIPFKAKQIVTEALIGMTTEEVENLLLTGLYDNESTKEFLDQEAERGGLGLDSRTAEKIADKIKSIIKEIKLLEDEDSRLRLRASADTGSEIMEIRHYLLEEFDIKIKDFLALEVLNQAIKDRMSNVIDRDEVRRRFDLPVRQGGVGLDKRTAKKVAKRLELLILGKYK